MKIVLDTSIYVEYLRTSSGIFKDVVFLCRQRKAVLYTPSIVFLELFVGKSASKREVRDKIKRLVSPTRIVPLNRQLAQKAGEIVRGVPNMGNEDAIIAATALHLKASLATRNEKHFRNIEGLKLFKLQK